MINVNILPTEKERQIIEQYCNADVRNLALKLNAKSDIRKEYILRQIEGRQIISRKVPSWDIPEIVFPKHLSLEQCSSELSASYKASLVCGDSFIDLTGGFGVDFSFFAKHFHKAVYVEQQQELVDIARHNLPFLCTNDISIVCNDAESYLNITESVDCIFIDPARRSSSGAKTVHLADCSPNLQTLENQLISKSNIVIAKLSPMLDITEVLSQLNYVAEIHVIAVNGECKELLLILKCNKQELKITAVNILSSDRYETISFLIDDEKRATCQIAQSLGKYLYEPNAALMKAGAYRIIAQTYNISKLHTNSHLYTSDSLIDNFPGRCFEIIECGGLGKNALPQSIRNLKKANIIVRNFPLRPDEIKHRLKLSDGGEEYIIATTIADRHVLLHCHRLTH